VSSIKPFFATIPQQTCRYSTRFDASGWIFTSISLYLCSQKYKQTCRQCPPTKQCQQFWLCMSSTLWSVTWRKLWSRLWSRRYKFERLNNQRKAFYSWVTVGPERVYRINELRWHGTMAALKWLICGGASSINTRHRQCGRNSKSLLAFHAEKTLFLTVELFLTKEARRMQASGSLCSWKWQQRRTFSNSHHWWWSGTQNHINRQMKSHRSRIYANTTSSTVNTLDH